MTSPVQVRIANAELKAQYASGSPFIIDTTIYASITLNTGESIHYTPHLPRRLRQRVGALYLGYVPTPKVAPTGGGQAN